MLEKLIAYNHDANYRVIDVFNKADKETPQAERLFSHILNAQEIWLCRMNGVAAPLDRFKLQPVKDFAVLQDNCTQNLKAILQQKELSLKITYRTSLGQEFTNTIADILFHVVNHSTYHRAQIATLFRASGIEPPITDYVAMIRETAL